MARVTCAISGVRFECSFYPEVNIGHTAGYFHPLFALPIERLYPLYTAHSHGQLTATESYLLFLAFLHTSDKVIWEHPVICNPNDARTKMIVQNNIAQLIRVLEKTAVIKHPKFKQPSFKVTFHTSHLDPIPNWIKAWQENIDFFNQARATIRERQSLLEIENKLTALIVSGEKPEKYAHVVANWASEAAGFPSNRNEEWKQVIRSCFNITKMFNTPLPLLKEIKEYCECNIEAGSLHFHALCNVLKEGISRHVDYLGGTSLALGYTLIPNLGSGSKLADTIQEELNREKLLDIIGDAPDKPPVEKDYPTKLAFIKAGLAYRLAQNAAKNEAREKRAAEIREILHPTKVYEPEPQPSDSITIIPTTTVTDNSGNVL